MIRLHTFGPRFELPDASPFCMKLELFLRLAELPFERRACDLAQAPKGKAPYVEIDGRLIGDTALVMAELERRHAINLDWGLTPQERAAAHALAVMLEERTYFAILFNRWLEDDNWPITRRAYFPDLPAAVALRIREEVRQTLHQQGIGRHDPVQIYDLAARDVDALAAWLGDTRYMNGADPTRLDCTAGAFVLAIQAGPYRSPIRDRLRSHPNLVAYATRMLARFGPPVAAAA